MVGASEAMLRYALASGIAVPEAVFEIVARASARKRAQSKGDAPESTPAQVRQLVRAHAELVRLVAPATPRTILLLSEGRRSPLSMLGPVRLVRQMLVAVLILLALFVALSTTKYVNKTSGDILTSTGLGLFVNELFFLTAGGLGAAFSALFTAYRYIADGTYDPKYESTYWLRFILGLMAGLLLPALIPLTGSTDNETFTRPLLALLGGFSAAVLYRILERLVGAVESLVRADSRELRVARRDAAYARATEQAGAERLSLIGDLRRLEQQARAGDRPDELADELSRVVNTLMPASRVTAGEDTIEEDAALEAESDEPELDQPQSPPSRVPEPQPS
jgi:hypothetical protein